MNILIFGGTTEGRTLAEALARQQIPCTVCVATEYGEQVMPPSEYIEVRQGRLTREQMAELIATGGYTAVVDATHPFAALVSENIRSSAGTLPLIRWQRPVHTASDDSSITYFDTPDQCAKALLQTEGPVLLTTGSKDLATFCAAPNLRKRLMVRVLPAFESLKLCYDAGLEGKQILAMQGPFSQSLNESQITEYGIKVLVTKESGKTGGLDAKVLAARNQHISCYIIRPPECCSTCHTATILDEVLQQLNLPSHLSPAPAVPIQPSSITLVGIGMGNPDSLTKAAQNAISQSDIIFGAPRMLSTVTALSNAPTHPGYLAKDILPPLTDLLTTSSAPVHAVILFSGDTGFYSGAGKLYSQLQKMLTTTPQLPPTELTLLPGISSIQYLSAKTSISWQDAAIISTHGIARAQWELDLQSKLNQREKIFFITSGIDDVRDVVSLAHSYDLYLGYQLSYPEEQIIVLTSGELAAHPGSTISSATAFLNPKGLWCGFLIPDQKLIQ